MNIQEIFHTRICYHSIICTCSLILRAVYTRRCDRAELRWMISICLYRNQYIKGRRLSSCCKLSYILFSNMSSLFILHVCPFTPVCRGTRTKTHSSAPFPRAVHLGAIHCKGYLNVQQHTTTHMPYVLVHCDLKIGSCTFVLP